MISPSKILRRKGFSLDTLLDAGYVGYETSFPTSLSIPNPETKRILLIHSSPSGEKNNLL